jgi:hypothetical protein
MSIVSNFKKDPSVLRAVCHLYRKYQDSERKKYTHCEQDLLNSYGVIVHKDDLKKNKAFIESTIDANQEDGYDSEEVQAAISIRYPGATKSIFKSSTTSSPSSSDSSPAPSRYQHSSTPSFDQGKFLVQWERTNRCLSTIIAQNNQSLECMSKIAHVFGNPMGKKLVQQAINQLNESSDESDSVSDDDDDADDELVRIMPSKAKFSSNSNSTDPLMKEIIKKTPQPVSLPLSSSVPMNSSSSSPSSSSSSVACPSSIVDLTTKSGPGIAKKALGVKRKKIN